MLSRKFHISLDQPEPVMPTLALESNPARPNQPSPFRHMNLHCQLCLDMVKAISGSWKSDAEKIWQVKVVVDEWFASLPPEYALENPNELGIKSSIGSCSSGAICI
jgi:hypothetical protein